MPKLVEKVKGKEKYRCWGSGEECDQRCIYYVPKEKEFVVCEKFMQVKK